MPSAHRGGQRTSGPRQPLPDDLQPAGQSGRFQAAGTAVPVNTYDCDGNVSGDYPAFRKDTLAASRIAVEQALARDGWTIAREEADHQAAHCGVCSTALHPLVSEQWYFDIRKGLARAGKPPQFHSALWHKGFELWLDKLRRPIANRYHETLNTSDYGGYATNRDFQGSSQSLWGRRCRSGDAGAAARPWWRRIAQRSAASAPAPVSRPRPR